MVEEIFATAAGAERFADLVGDRPLTLVDGRAMASLSEAESPVGLVALCRFLDREVELDAVRRPLLVICADVRDPGNAGTVIRCADAAGASGVILAGDSVDPYNAKTVRATVGSLFHVPLSHVCDPLEAVARVRAAGYRVLAADGGGEVDLFGADALLAGPTAWLFGNEARGLPAELSAAADQIVSIPIFGQAESLNLATAAAVCLYASARSQRR
ncbi:MAG: TrmH family RNA methyltransferase [Marmoricola sp.]